MDITINQKQNRELLTVHAESSYNFTFMGRNEWILASINLIIGVAISIYYYPRWFLGLPFIAIGIFELIKFPNRVNRWVNRKEKEKIFNKDFQFIISDSSLTVSYDDESKVHEFKDMRQCLISDSGILFKISYKEYYYISYSSLGDELKVKDLINNLKTGFDEDKIKVKRTHNNA
ncbi:hypothetical protein OO013_07905 [Mangrovivirga sp. M17]|uniref:YcxB-like protein domain-containing protein n=1 Tax=Mangrovivirga halotolerans TaxID=2993936 RepID=A0ABT3RQX0_9BACT|nr:hypothetical protein [Mangrovivirga halotolerans]MCX2743784.1 hypothetical protein [Mangrovivirga halotolerans]